MQLRIVAATESKEPWLSTAQELYSKKLKYFCDFDFIAVKPFKEARSQVEEKIEKESFDILKKINEKDYVILCDLKGKEFTSLEFSKHLTKKIENFSNRRFVFVIGGAYGVSETLRERSQELLKFSKMTMNHHVALVVLLEQIYRSFTIQKNIPYHNE